MMKDLKVTLENRPGTLADLSEALGKAGVNIEGIAGFAREIKGGEDREFVTHIAHILVHDATPAKKALVNAGIKIEEEREAERQIPPMASPSRVPLPWASGAHEPTPRERW